MNSHVNKRIAVKPCRTTIFRFLILMYRCIDYFCFVENGVFGGLNKLQVLNSIFEHKKQKNYLLTTAFNRNGFVFEKQTAINLSSQPKKHQL